MIDLADDMRCNLIDRLPEGGQFVRRPAGLLDIVEAYHAKFLGDIEAEFVSSGIHEATSKKVGDAKYTVRPVGAAEEQAGDLGARSIGGRAEPRHADFHSSFLRRFDECPFAPGNASAAYVGCNDGEPFAARAPEHVEGLTGRSEEH